MNEQIMPPTLIYIFYQFVQSSLSDQEYSTMYHILRRVLNENNCTRSWTWWFRSRSDL